MTTPVTSQTYYATLDALTKARALEDAHYARIVAGEPGAAEAMAAWWRAAEPRWRELEAVLVQAEAEDWPRAMVWLDLWREARKAGKAPGSVNAPSGGPGTQAEAATARKSATEPRQRGIFDPRAIEAAGSV